MPLRGKRCAQAERIVRPYGFNGMPKSETPLCGFEKKRFREEGKECGQTIFSDYEGAESAT